MEFNWYVLVFLITIFMSVGWIGFGGIIQHRKSPKKRKPKLGERLVGWLIYFTLFMAVVILTPMFFKKNFWDDNPILYSYGGEIVISVILYGSFAAMATFILILGFAMSQIKQYPFVDKKGRLKTNLNLLHYFLNSILNWTSFSVFLMALLFFIIIIFFPLMVFCRPPTSDAFCTFFNSTFDQTTSYINRSLYPNKFTIISILSSGIIAYIFYRYRSKK